ncbi:MAG: hypothetical protein KGL43_11550, partial [Burkholderiales bacterium]|nr:hypothetical protein [Burkholderiales bacterium]
PDGGYSLTISGYSGAVQLVASVTGSTTVADEVSGRPVSLPGDFTLHANAVVAAGAGSQTVSASLTPFTELANQLAQGYGGLTAAHIANANGVVFKLLGLDPVATVPVASNAAQSAVSTASVAQLRYGLYLAAVSQLANSTPSTSNPTTQACFAQAGDLGARIQCATAQIADAVTVAPGTTNAVATDNLVGLKDALLAISSSAANQTGQTIGAGDSVVAMLEAQESALANGSAESNPISSGTVTQAATDVATAKLFFAGLRSNAAALGTSTVSTGIVDGMKAFGDSLNTDAASLSLSTGEMLQLVSLARSLWLDYTSGQTTNPSIGLAVGGYGGCTVYQGTFPASSGAAVGQDFVPSAVTATSASNASWVACAVDHGPLLTNGTPRYRQVILINAGAGWASAAYLASTRRQYISLTDGQTHQVNLTPTLTGNIGITTNGTAGGYSVVGDLPPATDASGNLLSARYPVDIVGTLGTLASGAVQLSLSSGTLGVVPVGASASSLVIDLAVGGQLVAVLPQDRSNAAQVAAAQISWTAAISEPNGSLTGGVVINQFSYDASTGALVPGHLKFSGSVAVAPLRAGVAGPVATWTSLTLEATNGSTPVLSFSGSLTPPGLAPLALSASITEKAAGTYSLQGSYVQGGVNVSIVGTRSPGAGSVTFADASGVSVTLTEAASQADVTVSGRQAAVIDRGSDLITYSDGSFETLMNP